MKETKFIHIFSNIVIVLLIVSLTLFVFTDNMQAAVMTSKPYYRGDEGKKCITLMVNVYWGTEFLEDMLRIFDEYNVKTTFFIGGCWAVSNSEELKSIYSHGHEIGNHGYLHRDHSQMSLDANLKEIKMASDAVKNILGIEPVLFAPPSGAFNNNVIAACDKLSYNVIMWSKDTIDWRDKDENLIYNRATKNPVNGDLILMHPTSCTVKALPRILEFYKAAGFECVTVSENISSGV
ncbi:MAG: polysaccharide deacetylase family protein [Christensenellales bacterium]